MGLLSSLGSVVKKVGSAVKETIIGVNPFGGQGFSVAPGVKQKIGTTATKAIEFVANHPFISAAGVTAVANPAASAAVAKKVATSAAKSFTSMPVSKQIATGALAYVGTSAVIASPKLANAALNTPSSLGNFGANIGAFAENPNIGTATKIVKDNPILSAATAVAGGTALLGGASGLANTIATSRNTAALNELQAQNPLMVAQAAGASPAELYKAKKQLQKQQKAARALAEQQAKGLSIVAPAPALTQIPPAAAAPIAPAAVVAAPPAEKPAEVVAAAVKPKKKKATKKKRKAAPKKRKKTKKRAKPKPKKKARRKPKKRAKRKVYKKQRRKKRK